MAAIAAGSREKQAGIGSAPHESFFIAVHLILNIITSSLRMARPMP
jgi:hypothetical protein